MCVSHAMASSNEPRSMPRSSASNSIAPKPAEPRMSLTRSRFANENGPGAPGSGLGGGGNTVNAAAAASPIHGFSSSRRQHRKHRRASAFRARRRLAKAAWASGKTLRRSARSRPRSGRCESATGAGVGEQEVEIGERRITAPRDFQNDLRDVEAGHVAAVSDRARQRRAGRRRRSRCPARARQAAPPRPPAGRRSKVRAYPASTPSIWRTQRSPPSSFQ